MVVRSSPLDATTTTAMEVISPVEAAGPTEVIALTTRREVAAVVPTEATTMPTVEVGIKVETSRQLSCLK